MITIAEVQERICQKCRGNFKAFHTQHLADVMSYGIFLKVLREGSGTAARIDAIIAASLLDDVVEVTTRRGPRPGPQKKHGRKPGSGGKGGAVKVKTETAPEEIRQAVIAQCQGQFSWYHQKYFGESGINYRTFVAIVHGGKVTKQTLQAFYEVILRRE